ncbi:hypothetical protein Tco_0085930 [Tanacetum coccineum]
MASDEGWNRIEEYVQYQDDLWDDVSPPMNISSISKAIQPTFIGRLKRACNQIFYLETPTREVGLKNPYLICDYCGESHEADECMQTNRAEQVCLSRGDIYNDPSILRFYQNDNTSPWGNNKYTKKGENGPEWVVRSKFEDELANFMLEKKSHAKGIGDMLVQHHKELRGQYSQILSIINKSMALKPKALTFAITTRSGISIQDPPFLALPRPMVDNFTDETKKGRPKDAEPGIIQEPTHRLSVLYQPSKSFNLPFPSRLKKQKKDDEDEQLLLIFKQIHINLPFLEAMIHMPKGAKESAQEEGGPGSFTLPCLIGPLAVKKALADLEASINLMPYSLI